MQVQSLYDFRECTEFCSGEELQEFLQKVINDPAPAGSTKIKKFYADDFVNKCADKIAHNSPNLSGYARKVKNTWKANPKAFTREEWESIFKNQQR